MKKLFLLLLFSPLLSMAQSRIGYSEQQIREEFSEYNFETRFQDSGRKFIVTQNKLGVMYYYFNEDGICDECYLMANKDKLHAIIEKYNREMTIVSDTKWKYYGDDIIIYIEMVYAKEYQCYVFIYKPSTN